MTYVNRAFLEIASLTLDQALGAPHSIIRHPAAFLEIHPDPVADHALDATHAPCWRFPVARKVARREVFCHARLQAKAAS